MNLLFRSTRLRLAIWYTSVTAILLLLFGTGFYVYVRSTLIDRIDDTLKHVIEVVERSVIIKPIATPNKDFTVNVEASFRYKVDIVEDDRIDLEWFTPQEQLLWSTFSEPLDVPLHHTRLYHNRHGETITLSPERIFRQITETVQLEGKTLGYLRVSHPWFEVTKPIRQLTKDLIIGISCIIASVGAIGWWLSGLAIEPVRKSYASLKQFTADASHELRNPIAIIQTNVQLALAYPEAEPQQQQKQLQIIERLTQRLGKLVNDLLFLARSDSGIVEMDWQPIPLDALLLEVIEEQKTFAEQKGLTLNLNIQELEIDDGKEDQISHSEEIFTILGDWDRLARLFTNLIVNAINYSKGNDDLAEMNDVASQIIIELAYTQQMFRKSKLGDRSVRDYLLIKIKDTGQGIAESDLPFIFDRFYRVDPARSRQLSDTGATGSGLGLAIAKAVAESHSGYITLESELKVGTTFNVFLPKVAISN